MDLPFGSILSGINASLVGGHHSPVALGKTYWLRSPFGFYPTKVVGGNELVALFGNKPAGTTSNIDVSSHECSFRRPS
jgi:hypothetical protein